MKRTVLLLVLAVAASVAIAPMIASAHTSCATDDLGDAPAGYDIGEFCITGGDEDPVVMDAFVDAPAEDVQIEWSADNNWSVQTDGTAVTVFVLGQDSECDGASVAVTEGTLYEVAVPASCLPSGLTDVTASTSGADGVVQDSTPVAVGGVPPLVGADGSENPTEEATAAPVEGFTRLAGPTRIDTAVTISQDAWPQGAPGVLLANAENPVDALPASRAGVEGPILYVPPCGDLPTVVAEEIHRLQPSDIVLLGGLGAVCNDIGVQAVAARDGDGSQPPTERTEGTPNPDAVPADRQDGDVRSAAFILLDTRPDEGYEDAAGDAFIARNEAGVTVTIRVTGLPPNTAYNSHLHDGSCTQDNGGDHFMFDPEGSDTPPNEIHLPFITDEAGNGEQTSTHTEVPDENGRSIVVHPRDNGPARVMCAEWPAS